MGILRSFKRAWQRQNYNISCIYQRAIDGKWPSQVIFLHVPKTGGTSIQKYISRYTGSNRSGRSVRFDSIYNEPDERTIIKAQQARYVGGHIDWHTLKKFSNSDAFIFTVLRNPFERLLSTYLYLTNFPKEIDGYQDMSRIQGMGIKEFLSSDDYLINLWTRNIMYRQFGGAFSDFYIDEQRINKSIENLSSMSYIGFQHHLEQDLKIIATKCHIPVHCEEKRSNVTPLNVHKEEIEELMRGEFSELVANLIEIDCRIYNSIIGN